MSFPGLTALAGAALLLMAGLAPACSSSPAGADLFVPSSGTDASRSDASPVSLPCVRPQCENFETDAWKTSWSATGGAVGVTSGPSTSGSFAIDLNLTSDRTSFYTRPLGGDRHVNVTMQIRILTEGDGEIDFMSVAEMPGDSNGIHVVHARDASYVVEIPGATQKEIRPLGQSFREYTRVRLEIDLVLHKYVVTVGDTSLAGDLEVGWVPAALFVVVGASYAQSVTKAWHIRFDDAEITTSP